jgi:outer membrane lipoprotein-sorting protein
MRNPLHIQESSYLPIRQPPAIHSCAGIDDGVSFRLVRLAEIMTSRNLRSGWEQRAISLLVGVLVLAGLIANASAQTECGDGNGVLDTGPPKDTTPQDLIQKFTAQETKVRDARAHYTYTQDVMVQTLTENKVDGQFHQVTTISYDDKGKRLENVTYSEQPTLRNINMSKEDWDDIRSFMPLILTSEDAAEYTLTYTGAQHVDDLDTYVFHVVPKKEEKNKRYFQGKIWIDNHDLEIVKLCGKSVPEQANAKKKQSQEVRPMFAGYRQLVDGWWFPAYVRVDDNLQFHAESVHVREIVKFTGYKRANGPSAKQ